MARAILAKLACAAALVALAAAAAAQNYPARPVKIVVPYPPGSLPDQIARVVSTKLHERFGQPFLVDNRSGALGTVGTTEVARSAPDGYTFLLTTNTTQAANVALFKDLQYDPVKDFAPVVVIAKTSMILLVKPDFPAQTLKGFIAYARSKNGQLSAGYGSAGAQVSIAKLKAGGKFETLDVPYKGVPLAVTDVLSGQVNFTFADFAVSLAQIRGGKLKGIAVTSAQRTPLAPEIPAIAEELPGFETVLWYGLVAPAGTPRTIVNQVYEATVAGIADPQVTSRFAGFGVDVAPMNPDEMGAYIKSEIAKWSKEAKQSGIQPQ